MANALTLPAIPDMNPAISAVTPSPNNPGPAYRASIRGSTSLYVWAPAAMACLSFSPTRPGRTANPSRPGRITMSGTNILNPAPIIGASFAERRSRAERTRCTTRKSVVQ